jgi:sec-independent protein translocase protein TatA
MISSVLQPSHVIVVVLIALLIFGPKRIPELGRSLGRGMREFKDGITGHEDEKAELPTATAEAPAHR